MAIKEVQCTHCGHTFRVRIPNVSHYSKQSPEYKKRLSARTAVHTYFAKVIRDHLGHEISQSSTSVEGWLERKVGYGGLEFLVRMVDTMPPGFSLTDWHEGHLHIDHIKPFSTFNCGDFKQDIMDSFALENLRMITKSENLGRNKILTTREEK